MSKPCAKCYFYNKKIPCCDYLHITGKIRDCSPIGCRRFLTKTQAIAEGYKKENTYNRGLVLSPEEKKKLKAYLKEAYSLERAKTRMLNY